MSSSIPLAMPQPRPQPPPAAYLNPSANHDGEYPEDDSPAPSYSLTPTNMNSKTWPDSANTVEAARSITRTPSPTPSEVDLLNGITPKKERSTAQVIRRLLIIAIIVVAIVLIEVYHDKIIDGLKPVTRWLHGLRGGWVIPIIVLIALSFPPLFGHEVVAMLCGLVWGLGAGFGIVAAGTILGEILTYYVFRYLCSARASKLELTNLQYGLLAHTIRRGGIWVAIVARYSALPGHLTTAVFATCGMGFWVFLVAAVVSLPKQLAIVYVGFALGQNEDKKSNTIQKVVIAVTVVVTVIAMLYIRRLMGQARPELVYARRKARQAKLQGEVETEAHDHPTV
ncbi:hypothetical protein MIND_01302900 [Mycena indigotica]|uniref:Golgi apparatus membrane protein TVP38 n=1 Tax=Mycena indigotica TaxID=2126181 RepID=A0A8H6VQT5_9AGAR|nr:uncharacterized protein MIND_01302900 [Mycena indigotica]KAF7290627.1 hypothetical protein MIND_01302900 [Mycena indigotica]